MILGLLTKHNNLPLNIKTGDIILDLLTKPVPLYIMSSLKTLY